MGRPPVTEIRPGEYIFNDIGKLRIGACGPADLALFVASVLAACQTQTDTCEHTDADGDGYAPALATDATFRDALTPRRLRQFQQS